MPSPAPKSGKPMPKHKRLALLRAFRQEDRQRWREARRALLAGLPMGATWHVALVVAGKEAKAERALVQAGFHAYGPLERVTIGRGPTRRDEERPLFPRYVFFARRLAGADVEVVREVIEVLGGLKGQWLTVPERLVRGLIDSEGLGAFDHTEAKLAALRAAKRAKFCTGAKVVLIDGPLAGFPAELMALKAEKRVACLVRMFGGEVRVEVGIDKIEAAA